MGANANLNFNSKYFSGGIGLGFTDYLRSPGGLGNSVETRFGYGASINTRIGKGSRLGNLMLAIGGTKFGGTHGQHTGFITVGTEKVNYTFDNDVGKLGPIPLGDNGDRWRTAGNRLHFYGIDLGLLMYSGDPGLKGEDRETYINEAGNKVYEINGDGADPNSHRLGALYLGFGNTRVGYNSEAIRDAVQNEMIHKMKDVPYFQVMELLKPGMYGGFYSNNMYTTW